MGWTQYSLSSNMVLRRTAKIQIAHKAKILACRNLEANIANDSQRQVRSQKAAAACSVAMSTITERAASMQLANYPAKNRFGVATHRSQLKARTPLPRNAGHSAARSVEHGLKLYHQYSPLNYQAVDLLTTTILSQFHCLCFCLSKPPVSVMILFLLPRWKWFQSKDPTPTSPMPARLRPFCYS